ncbi:MAG: Ig-like domain-containing protein [Puniceicoccaceae bacterium]
MNRFATKPNCRPYYRYLRLVTATALALASALAWSGLQAQRVAVSDQGLFYYIIIERDTGRTARQGQMDFGGFNNLILAPNTNYTLYALYTENLGVATQDFTTSPNGVDTEIPAYEYYDLDDFDTDGDGLSDLREFIVGTNLFNPDTDGDGIRDGPEVVQGLNPLDGFIVETGIVGAGLVQGATTICVNNNLAIVGQVNYGITVFNVTEAANPIRISDVPIDGTIRDVDCAAELIAVAASDGGLVVVDITDPPSATVERTLHLGSPVHSVAINGDQAYAGLANGFIVWVDLNTGIELARILPTGDPVSDLGLGKNVLYAVAGNRFYTVDIKFNQFNTVHSLDLQGRVPCCNHVRRLFVGDTFAVLNHERGFMTLSLDDPLAPELRSFNDLGVFGFKWGAANGSGLMVAAVSANGALDGPQNVTLYEIGDNGELSELVVIFETPDIARSVAIFNGLAYVTDWKAGQQNGNLLVLNYLPYDSGGIPPSIELVTDAIENQFEEGKVMTATARVGDDIQVRNVEFIIDGESRFIDGNFPFEFRFPTPLITATKDRFTIEAVATDTGGNIARAEEIIILLTPDGTPPFVMNVIPRNNAIVGELSTIAITFSEVLDTATIFGTPPPDAPPETPANPGVRVFSEGLDGVPGNGDDERIDGSLEWDEDTRTVYFNFASPAEEGTHTIRVLETIQDLAGNALTEEFVSRFTQAGFEDSDLDGLPDNVEVILGMDPFNPDTDGDGLLDGEEDNDADGLTNTAEILYGTDPQDEDSDDNTIKDGDEDFDNDGLLNKEEFAANSDPFDPDTDNDGYDDAGEVAENSDPSDPASRPLLGISSFPASFMNANAYGIYGNIDFRISSSPYSYYNDQPFQVPTSISVFLKSTASSYSNMTDFEFPPGTRVDVASSGVSYDNN